MTKKTEKEINNQINEELFSSYLYLSMAAYAKEKSLDGFANWFEIQAKEEIDHAMGFYHYLLDANGTVELEAIKKPQSTFAKPIDLFTGGLKHEKHITARINFLYDLAQEEKDHSLKSLLKWYLDEQVEEEANAKKYVDKMTLAGDDGSALLMIDTELAARIYTPLNPRGTLTTA